MNRKNFGLLAGAMALAGLTGFGQTAQSLAVKSANEIQATNKRKSKREALPFVTMAGGPDKIMPVVFGLTPKEYGMRFGNGGCKKSNRLRYSHNAKLKRRNINA